MSAFKNWRAKDGMPSGRGGHDFDEFVLWLATKKKDAIHLEVMGDHDLFIDIAGVLFNLHVTKAGAVLKLTLRVYELAAAWQMRVTVEGVVYRDYEPGVPVLANAPLVMANWAFESTTPAQETAKR